MPFGDVADADDVAVAPVELGLADGDLDRNAIAALGKTPGLVRGQVHVRVVDLGRPGARDNRTGRFASMSASSKSERAAEDLGGGVAEDALAGVIE